MQVGQIAKLSKIFTQEDVSTFAKLSLDTNPVHLDEDYAKTTIFGRKIIHGFLSGSLISGVIGTLLPGNGAIYLHQDMDFKNPVYVGEIITAIVQVENVKVEKRIAYLSTICVNQDNEVKITGNAVIKY